jgi:hypothetical protein
MQEFGGNTGDMDDDEGGGMVSNIFRRKIASDLLNFYQITHIRSIINYKVISANAL